MHLFKNNNKNIYSKVNCSHTPDVQYSLFSFNLIYNGEELNNQELKFFHFNDSIRKKRKKKNTIEDCGHKVELKI